MTTPNDTARDFGSSDCSSALLRVYDAIRVLKGNNPVWGERMEEEFRYLEEWVVKHPRYLYSDSQTWKEKISRLRKRVEEMNVNILQSNNPWPEVPTKRQPIKQAMKELPNTAGVYFAFEGRTGRCVYVGQSQCLILRCGFHGKQRADGNLRIKDWFSYLLFPYSEVFFAENYYIGLLRPERNQPAKFCTV